MDETQRCCIISNIKLDSPTILDDLKSAVKIQKSSIVERKHVESESVETTTVNSELEEAKNKSSETALYMRNDQYNSRSGSKGRGRYDDRFGKANNYDYYRPRSRSRGNENISDKCV